MQGKRSKRAVEVYRRVDWQGPERALERTVTHARGHDQIFFVGCADERKCVPAALRVRVRRIDQDHLDRLPRLETEAGWFVEMKCRRAFRNFLPLPEFCFIRRHAVSSPGSGRKSRS